MRKNIIYLIIILLINQTINPCFSWLKKPSKIPTVVPVVMTPISPLSPDKLALQSTVDGEYVCVYKDKARKVSRIIEQSLALPEVVEQPDVLQVPFTTRILEKLTHYIGIIWLNRQSEIVKISILGDEKLSYLQLAEICKAADYLDIPILLEAITDKIAVEIIAFDDRRQFIEWRKIFISTEIQKIIARKILDRKGYLGKKKSLKELLRTLEIRSYGWGYI